MALNNSTPAHAAASASSSAASAIAGLRGAPKSRPGADDDPDGFAAQLLRAQPQEAKPAQPEAKSDAKDKPAAKDDKDAKDDAPPAAPDASALLPWAQLPPAAPSTAALAAQSAGDPIASALAGLKKGAAKTGKDAGAEALAAGKDAKADAGALAGKGVQSATDFGAALGKAGAANLASETKDSMAALLPQADAATVQAGAIGASPNAVVDYKTAAEQAGAAAPAQATLPMAPQSPAFAPALGQQIEVWLRDGIQHAEVQLSPQELGPIRVKIAVEGAATQVQMSADVASTREALQQALPQLADSLGQVGLSLTGGGVSDQSTAQSQGQFQMAGDGGSGAPGGRGGSTRSGLGGGDAGGDPLAASAVRQAAQRRGLLDMYA